MKRHALLRHLRRHDYIRTVGRLIDELKKEKVTRRRVTVQDERARVGFGQREGQGKPQR